jgi:hypothetical protein
MYWKIPPGISSANVIWRKKHEKEEEKKGGNVNVKEKGKKGKK